MRTAERNNKIKPCDSGHTLNLTSRRVRVHHSPMHQYTSATVESILDEGIGRSEMLEQVFVVDIVYLDDKVPVEGEERFVKRQT